MAAKRALKFFLTALLVVLGTSVHAGAAEKAGRRKTERSIQAKKCEQDLVRSNVEDLSWAIRTITAGDIADINQRASSLRIADSDWTSIFALLERINKDAIPALLEQIRPSQELLIVLLKKYHGLLKNFNPQTFFDTVNFASVETEHRLAFIKIFVDEEWAKKNLKRFQLSADERLRLVLESLPPPQDDPFFPAEKSKAGAILEMMSPGQNRAAFASHWIMDVEGYLKVFDLDNPVAVKSILERLASSSLVTLVDEVKPGKESKNALALRRRLTSAAPDARRLVFQRLADTLSTKLDLGFLSGWQGVSREDQLAILQRKLSESIKKSKRWVQLNVAPSSAEFIVSLTPVERSSVLSYVVANAPLNLLRNDGRDRFFTQWMGGILPLLKYNGQLQLELFRRDPFSALAHFGGRSLKEFETRYFTGAEGNNQNDEEDEDEDNRNEDAKTNVADVKFAHLLTRFSEHHPELLPAELVHSFMDLTRDDSIIVKLARNYFEWLPARSQSPFNGNANSIPRTSHELISAITGIGRGVGQFRLQRPRNRAVRSVARFARFKQLSHFRRYSRPSLGPFGEIEFHRIFKPAP